MAGRPDSPASNVRSLIVIAVVVAALVAAFVYTAGWLSPGRLTPAKLVDSLAPPGGPALGFRRNHAKGICFTGVFESNGQGAAHSRAAVFRPGTFAALGRFNLGTADPGAPVLDCCARVSLAGSKARDATAASSDFLDLPVFISCRHHPVFEPLFHHVISRVHWRRKCGDSTWALEHEHARGRRRRKSLAPIVFKIGAPENHCRGQDSR